jgi:hypothetical protein
MELETSLKYKIKKLIFYKYQLNSIKCRKQNDSENTLVSPGLV